MGERYHKKHREKRPQPKSEERINERIYKPAWICIYCGSDGGGRKLGREHILAAGLKGDQIIPRASCGSCEEVTGKLEAIVTNRNFGTFRRVMDIRSGRRPPPTELLRLVVKNVDGSQAERLVTPSDYPAQLLLPKLKLPGALTGNFRAPLMCDFQWVTLSKSQKLEIEERLGGEVITTASFDIPAFARMIAKIGYALAAAEIGLENFHPYGLKFIFGKQPEAIGGLVGQSNWFPDGLRTDASMHHLMIKPIPSGGRHLIAVGVHLFARHTPIVYTTIVGHLTPKESFWGWPGLLPLGPNVIESLRGQYERFPAPPLGDHPKLGPLRPAGG